MGLSSGTHVLLIMSAGVGWIANTSAQVGCTSAQLSSVLPPFNACRSCVTDSGLLSVDTTTPVRQIGERVFQSCNTLTTVTLPMTFDGVIGRNAFSSSSLTSVSMYTSLQAIHASAFADCANLRTISFLVAPTPAATFTIGNFAFIRCRSLTTMTVGATPQNSLPPSTTNVGQSAFSECNALRSLDIPSRVTIIERTAFFSSGLQSVNIGSAVTMIGDSAFGDTALSTINVPASVTLIGPSAFRQCTALRTVSGMSGVRTIDFLAFNWTGVRDIDLSQVIAIDQAAFLGGAGCGIAGGALFVAGADVCGCALCTAAPTASPTASPTVVPSSAPTEVPSDQPTPTPSTSPTTTTTATPTAVATSEGGGGENNNSIVIGLSVLILSIALIVAICIVLRTKASRSGRKGHGVQHVPCTFS